MMKKLIAHFVLGILLVAGISCTDQLRIDERETSFDVNYFTYSRYQLTTAIVNVAEQYGEAAKDEPKGEAMLYFMDAYTSPQMSSFYLVPDQNWAFQRSNPYTGQLRTLAAVSKLATDEGNMATVAAAKVLKCVVGAYLTEKYGDVPFSEAVEGRSGNIFPKFDPQAEIYESMFEMLDQAATILADPNSKGLPADHDVLFGGDKTKWLKFANSLKFRLMMHSYEAFKNAGKDLSGDMQAIASSNRYMSEVEDNASLAFSGINERESWYLQTKWGTGNDYTEQKPTKYLIDQMVAFDDPRMYVIFAPVLSPVSAKTEVTDEDIMINGYNYTITYFPSTLYEPSDLIAAGRDLNGNQIDVPYILDSKWFGTPNPLNVQLMYEGAGLPGSNRMYDNRRITGFSKLIAEPTNYALKAVMMESSEMMFLLAEARKKGWISAGTVKDYYEQGIKLSFERWGVVDGEKPETHVGSEKIIENYDAYCAKSGVALDGSASDFDKIALQKWLSLLLTNQTEALTDFLRTGKPEFIGKIAPSFSSYDFPLRYIYPLDESSNNKEQYDIAVAALGGKDLPSAKMWIRK
ncbi:MAG TPA: SusD/RagB family nutrient-binding outer membrane lipoprotein [Dysgonamonadaceae bacterium]|nr:SusD/RagB family nutrient-binding outer membrane lipoprotein [Dysgonamonadaceae bacterium]